MLCPVLVVLQAAGVDWHMQASSHAVLPQPAAGATSQLAGRPSAPLLCRLRVMLSYGHTAV